MLRKDTENSIRNDFYASKGDKLRQ